MENDMISCIEPQGALRRLLKDPTMRGFVVVSQVHSCSSYARILTAQSGGTIALGLSIEPPVSGVASATANATWVRSIASGNFKSGVNREGYRKFYPLFRLVSLKEEAISMGLQGGRDDSGAVSPLPDAQPPWEADEAQSTPKRAKFKLN
jgi:hypothetical protein